MALIGDMNYLEIGSNTYEIADASVRSAVTGTKTQNYVYAAPSSASGTPSFRALTGSDLPIASANTVGGIKVGAGL